MCLNNLAFVCTATISITIHSQFQPSNFFWWELFFLSTPQPWLDFLEFPMMIKLKGSVFNRTPMFRVFPSDLSHRISPTHSWQIICTQVYRQQVRTYIVIFLNNPLIYGLTCCVTSKITTYMTMMTNHFFLRNALVKLCLPVVIIMSFISR